MSQESLSIIGVLKDKFKKIMTIFQSNFSCTKGQHGRYFMFSDSSPGKIEGLIFEIYIAAA